MRVTLLTLCCVLALAGAAFAADKPGFTADKISVETEKPNRIILLGDVRFNVGDLKIESSGLVYNQAEDIIYAHGPVLVVDKKTNSRIYCDEFVYNIVTRSGWARSARLVTNRNRVTTGLGKIEKGEVYTLVFETELLKKNKETYSCSTARITSCGFANPHWWLEVDSVTITPKQELKLKGTRLKMGGLTLLGFSSLGLDISNGARYPQIDMRGGNTNTWGEYLRLRIRFPLATELWGAKTLYGVTVGYRRNLGTELGGNFEWRKPGIRGGVGVNVFSESVITSNDDNARATTRRLAAADKHAGGIKPSTQTAANFLQTARGEPILDTTTAETNISLDEFKHSDDLRTSAYFVHDENIGDWHLASRVHYVSDRDVMSEYYEKELKTGAWDSSYLNLTRDTIYGAFSLHTQTALNDYATHTSYLPELRWNGAAFDLGAGASLLFNSRVGLLEKTYDEKYGLAGIAFEDERAWRANAQVLAARPFRLAGVQFSPYAGVTSSWVEKTLTLDEPVTSTAGVWGMSASKKLFRTYSGGDEPIRHAIDLRLTYEHIDEPTHDPADLIGFDSVDDLMGRDRLHIEFLQNWQTKERDKTGVSHVRTIAGLALRTDYYLNEDEAAALNSGNDFGPLEASFQFSPSDSFSMYGSYKWNLENADELSSEVGITFGDSDIKMTEPDEFYWRTSLLYITNNELAIPSNQLAAELKLVPVGRWSMALKGGYELGDRFGEPAWTNTSVILTRDFHDWDFAVSAWYDPQDKDSGLSVSITPKGYPINLPRN